MTIPLTSETTPAPLDLLAIALRALEEPEMVAVLGDAVQRAGWFDVRVMQVSWPLGRAKRNGERTISGKQRRAFYRAAWTTGFPEFFASFTTKPSEQWARAVAAVLLFGGWQKGRWAVSAPRMQVYTNATVYLNGVPLAESDAITFSTRSRSQPERPPSVWTWSSVDSTRRG